jgi:hypothetical protein
VDTRERALYHQIHPAKLLTDWVTAIVACFLFWEHRWMVGLVVGLVPPILASAALMRSADLEPHRDSAFGRYVGRYMTAAMQALRLVGVAALWFGAWRHRLAAMALGVLVILGAWARGWLWPGRATGSPPPGSPRDGAGGPPGPSSGALPRS